MSRYRSGVRKPPLPGARRPQPVPITLRLVCKAVVEDGEGAFFLKATIVQTVRERDFKRSSPERPISLELSAAEMEELMFDVVLPKPRLGGEVSVRRAYVPRGTSWSQAFDLFVPLDVRSMWQRFPFHIFQASVDLGLQARLEGHGPDGEIPRETSLAGGCLRVEKENTDNFDRSRTLALLEGTPAIKFLPERTWNEERDGRWPEEESFNSGRFRVIFWLHEHPTEVFFNVLDPLLLVVTLVWVNFNEFYGITNIGAGCQATERDPGYLTNGIGVALTAVVMLPQIRTKKRDTYRRRLV